MPGTDAPRLATEDDYAEMMGLLDRFFHCERGGMAERLPFVYDPSAVERHAVVERDGRIVSHAAAIPQTFVVDGFEIQCWGIGGVATHKRHRGNGYMSRLLEFWLARADEAGVPLVELGGDRQRYGSFGWENAGRDYRYGVTERSFGDGPAAPEGAVETFDGSIDQVGLLQTLYGESACRAKRTPEETARILGQRGLETLVYEHADGPAYVSFTRESRERSVYEFGGPEDGVLSLLGHVLACYDVNHLTVFPPPSHPLHPALKRISAGWTVKPHRKLNVRDLHGVFTAYADVLSDEWQRVDRAASGELTLGIHGEFDGVRISYGSDGLAVERCEGPTDIELDRLETTRLLFGFHDDARALKRGHPVLEALLPLDFYVHHSQHV